MDYKHEVAQLSAFRARLTPQDRLQFDRGKRLTCHGRKALLAAMSADDVAHWGLFFPDDEEEHEPILWQPPALGNQFDVNTFRHKFRVQFWLMDAWDIYPPLHLDYMAAVIRCGVNLAFSGDRSRSQHARNHPSLLEKHADVLKVLDKEIAAGRRPEFLPVCPFKNALVSPVGAVPKSELIRLPSGLMTTLETVRVIHDWSAGYGQPRYLGVARDALNFFCAKQHIAFVKFDEIYVCFLRAGPSAWVIVQDVSHAHQSVMVRPRDWHLGVIHVPGRGWSWSPVCQYGCVRSAGIWECFGEFLVIMLLVIFRFGMLLRWVDDFFMFAPCSYMGARMLQATIVFASCRYGIYFSPTKFFGPDEWGKCLGLIWRPRTGEVGLPAEKVERYRRLFAILLEDSLWTFKEIEQTIGRLQHIANVIPQIRFMMPAWWATLSALRHVPEWQTSRPSTTLRWHLRAVLAIFESYRGSSVAFLHSRMACSTTGMFPPPPVAKEIFTDASGAFGWGAWSPDTAQFSYAAWAPGEADSHGASSPLFEVKGACYALCSLNLCNQRLTLWNDNNVFIGKMNGNRFGDNERMNWAMIQLLLIEIYLNVDLRVMFIPGTENICADWLSRGVQGLTQFRNWAALHCPAALVGQVPPVSPLGKVFLDPRGIFWSKL